MTHMHVTAAADTGVQHQSQTCSTSQLHTFAFSMLLQVHHLTHFLSLS
jgi:hypothetical protein